MAGLAGLRGEIQKAVAAWPAEAVRSIEVRHRHRHHHHHHHGGVVMMMMMMMMVMMKRPRRKKRTYRRVYAHNVQGSHLHGFLGPSS
jgi:hypothetical protein